MTGQDLSPVTKTRFADRITRAGRAKRECWAAETVDGVWDFDREDSPGTPWLVYHRLSVADGSYTLPLTFCGTLRACQAYAGGGLADQELTRVKAELATTREPA
jgi:hypothetical protein